LAPLWHLYYYFNWHLHGTFTFTTSTWHLCPLHLYESLESRPYDSSGSDPPQAILSGPRSEVD